MSAEEALKKLGLELPSPPPPGGIYKPVLVHGGLAYVSGHPPRLGDGTLIQGRVGNDLSVEEGARAARQAGLAMLATLRAELGSLDRILGLIKLLGMVNAAPEFADHARVVNGCSELFVAVFGEDRGIGARSAVGMGSLPGNIAVEIEAIFEMAE